MPRQYLIGLRDEMVRGMLTGEPVLSICSDMGGVAEQTLHRWKHQTLSDADLADGIDLIEIAALRTATKESSFLRKSFCSCRVSQRFMIPWRRRTKKKAGESRRN
jgi:hypothetical protein